MIDQLFDRHYQAGREPLNRELAAGVASIARSARAAFDALNRIQFAAPWHRKHKRIGWS